MTVIWAAHRFALRRDIHMIRKRLAAMALYS